MLTLGLLGGVSADWLLKTEAPVLGHFGLILIDPPEQCAGEFTMLALGGLGVGSGRYIGDGGEYGGGATGPGRVGVLTRRTKGVVHAGITMLTFTGQTGDLFAPALFDLFGELVFLANETDLDLLFCLEGVGVLLRALRGGVRCLCLGSDTVQGLAGLYVSNL